MCISQWRGKQCCLSGRGRTGQSDVLDGVGDPGLSGGGETLDMIMRAVPGAGGCDRVKAAPHSLAITSWKINYFEKEFTREGMEPNHSELLELPGRK